jgi:acyl-coenzyme A synthetase/AMP-(fatty) acid ligase
MAEPQHWNHFEWHPIYGPDLELVDPEAGLYEVVINRRPDQTWCSGVFFNFPQLDQWRTKDLFRKHDTESHLWVFHGRRDDVIILSSGLKVNPLIFESILQSHLGVDGAIVFGSSKLQCGILVEPRTSQAEEGSLLDELWLLVEKVNTEVQEHAKIDKGMIMVITRNKPFARSIKNTIVRSTTLEDYETEIREMYAMACL